MSKSFSEFLIVIISDPHVGLCNCLQVVEDFNQGHGGGSLDLLSCGEVVVEDLFDQLVSLFTGVVNLFVATD